MMRKPQKLTAGAQSESLILPDLLAAKDGACTWFEAKPAPKTIDGIAASITAMARAVYAEEHTFTFTGLRSVG